MNNKIKMSSDLWVVDDPFEKGKFVDYLEDHSFETDYPILSLENKIKICTKANRNELATEIELENPVDQIISGFLEAEVIEDHENLTSSSSWGVIVSQVNTSIVGEDENESSCFHALLQKTDDGNFIQGLIQDITDEPAYNTVDFADETKTEIDELIQVCDIGIQEKPLIVGLDKSRKKLIAQTSSGDMSITEFSKEFSREMVFSKSLSPGVRLVGFDGEKLRFIDIDNGEFIEQKEISIEKGISPVFFDSINSHKSDSPLFTFYDGKKLNFIDLFDMEIINSIEIDGLKAGIDSVCFSSDNGIIYIENTVISPEEIEIRKITLSEETMTPIFRFQIGSYDGGLFGFKKTVDGKSTIKIFNAYPFGENVIDEFIFTNIDGEIESIDFDKKTKKMFMFTSSMYYETENISKWKRVNRIELKGFE